MPARARHRCGCLTAGAANWLRSKLAPRSCLIAQNFWSGESLQTAHSSDGRRFAALPALMPSCRQWNALDGNPPLARRPKLGPGADVYRLFHDLAQLPGRHHSAQCHPHRSRRVDGAAGMDGECLHPQLRGAAARRQRARRPFRTPPHADGRPGVVHRRVGGLRRRAECRDADRRSRRPGRGRGADHAARHGACSAAPTPPPSAARRSASSPASPAQR